MKVDIEVYQDLLNTLPLEFKELHESLWENNKNPDNN